MHNALPVFFPIMCQHSLGVQSQSFAQTTFSKTTHDFQIHILVYPSYSISNILISIMEIVCVCVCLRVSMGVSEVCVFLSLIVLHLSSWDSFIGEWAYPLGSWLCWPVRHRDSPFPLLPRAGTQLVCHAQMGPRTQTCVCIPSTSPLSHHPWQIRWKCLGLHWKITSFQSKSHFCSSVLTLTVFLKAMALQNLLVNKR